MPQYQILAQNIPCHVMPEGFFSISHSFPVSLHTVLLHGGTFTGARGSSIILLFPPSTIDSRLPSVLQAETTSIVIPAAIIANAITHGGAMTKLYSALQ